MKDIVLITGGLGYIGGRITKYLSDESNVPLRITTRRKRAQPPAWLKNGEIVPLDLTSCNKKKLDSLCKDVKSVIHLAALNENDSLKDPALAFTINSLGSLNLLEAAEKNGVERFIYFSTAHAYGYPLQGKITEKKLPRPVHPYAITHKAAEDFVLAAHDQKMITGIVLRLSNGFGTPLLPDVDRWTLLVNDLCRQAVMSKQLVLRSSGIQVRDFITLHDVCRAVLHFLNLPTQKCIDGLFNLGGESSLKVIDMANLLTKRCKIKFGFVPEIIKPDILPNEIPTMLSYSIEKLRSTGFALIGNFVDEIDSTLQFCQKEFGQAT